MLKKTPQIILSLFSLLILSSCSSIKSSKLNSEDTSSSLNQQAEIALSQVDNNFLNSGTIILSYQVPKQDELAGNDTPITFAPIIGYFPPSISYLPADNEVWLEINKDNAKVTLYKGKNPVKEMPVEGKINLNPGDYFLQKKQKEPVWYAPDTYFSTRKLNVPSADDKLRYRKGALGKFAIFPTTTFPIHCASIWSEDVGGLRVTQTDLASIYYMLQIGAPVVVK
ncbi:MAG: L,D-transpeptidase [Proteobacteria bacterium]|nr:L,D-transpeptidase [Pseudomonadota bacterium]